MDYMIEEELLMLVPGLLSGIPTGLFGIATYVLTALAIYTLSRRRGLKKPWLAWIPVINCWLLGSLSDQYQYVVKGENKTKRKWLIALSIVQAVLYLLLILVAIALVGNVITGDRGHRWMGPVMGLLGSLLPMAAVSIAKCVIRYMALYDVYRSVDPDNAVLYLVLSILFSPTEPFFLFFNRDKDRGMPPRRQKAVYEQPSFTQEETYESVDNTEYL